MIYYGRASLDIIQKKPLRHLLETIRNFVIGSETFADKSSKCIIGSARQSFPGRSLYNPQARINVKCHQFQWDFESGLTNRLAMIPDLGVQLVRPVKVYLALQGV